MFNKKFLALSLSACLVGCGGAGGSNGGNDDNNNDDKKEKRYTIETRLIETDLFSGDYIAKANVAKDGDSMHDLFVLKEGDKAKAPQVKMEIVNSETGEVLNKSTCDIQIDKDLFSYKSISDDLGIVAAYREIVDVQEDEYGIGCTYQGSGGIYYIVRKSDGKAWAFNHYNGVSDVTSQVIRANSAHNSTDKPLIIIKNYRADGSHTSKVVTVEAPKDGNGDLKVEEILKLEDRHIGSNLTYNGEYMSFLSYEGGRAKPMIINPKTGFVPDYVEGLYVGSGALLIAPDTNELTIFRYDESDETKSNLYTFGDTLEATELVNKEKLYFDNIDSMRSVNKANGITYFVDDLSNIITIQSGIASYTARESTNTRMFVDSKESKDGNYLYVVNAKYAITVDYATGTSSSIKLTKGTPNWIDHEQAFLTDEGHLTYRTKGDNVYYDVFRTINVMTGDVIDERTIDTEDGREVYEITPVN